MLNTVPYREKDPINIFSSFLLLYSPLRPKGKSHFFYSLSHLKTNSVSLGFLFPLEL